MNNLTLNGETRSLEDHVTSLREDTRPWLQACGTFLDEWLQSHGQITVQTSGSTGEPKTISLRKEHMIASAQATIEHFRLDKGSRALHCLPVNYIAGKMMLVRALVGELDLCIVEPTLSPLAGSKLEDTNFTAMIPAQVERSILEHKEQLERISTLIIGGAPVNSQLHRQLQTLSSECYSTYGMTETITHVATKRLNYGAQSSFQALPGVRFWQDERSCLTIQCEHLGIDNLVTNDVVELEDTKHFQWLGRVDNVINSGGTKLFPEQIEKKLENLLDRRYYITSKTDDQFGQRPKLMIEGPDFDTTTLRLLQSTLEDALDKIEVPDEIVFVSQFEETATGKIKRN